MAIKRRPHARLRFRGQQMKERSRIEMIGVPGRSGNRNRKTTAEHVANGSCRADRHGGRIDGVDAAGDPIKPDDLSAL
jgi:hypothetical protein